jgi:hypothetical protein
MADGTQNGLPQRAPPSRVHVLLPVWKDRYVAQFLDLCLPSLLAGGNVPSVARTLPCTFTVLTRRRDAPRIREHPRWRDLAALCQAEISLIDDLIRSENHAMTLTLAYARAMRTAGAGMRDTCFFLLVSDFILANGALARALESVHSGASGVLSGSIQVVAEEALAWARELVAPAAASLVLDPRHLMGWSRRHLHPSTLASIVGCPFAHDPYANRLFWRVDAHTLLGRFYLMHPLALHPEVAEFWIGSSCDYAFVPELIPSGNVVTVADSDELLVVEAQPRDAARRLRPGPITPRNLAQHLSEWTTAEHRSNASSALLFHDRELPTGIDSAIACSERFVALVERNLARRPQSHRHHPYWIAAQMLSEPAPAWPDAGAPPRAWVEAALWHVNCALLGRPPQVSPWHARWPDFQLLSRQLKRTVARGEALCVVARSPERFAAWLTAEGAHVRAFALEELSTAPPAELADALSACATCVMVASEGDLADGELHAQWARAAKGGNPMLLLLTGDIEQRLTSLSSRVPDLLGGLTADITGMWCARRGARLTLDGLFAGLVRATRAAPMLLLPVMLVGAGLCAAAIAACNLMTMLLAGRPPGALTACSSLLLVLEAPPCQDKQKDVHNCGIKGRRAVGSS